MVQEGPNKRVWGGPGFSVAPGMCEGSGDLQGKVSQRLEFLHLVLGRNQVWYRKEAEAVVVTKVVPEGIRNSPSVITTVA